MPGANSKNKMQRKQVLRMYVCAMSQFLEWPSSMHGSGERNAQLYIPRKWQARPGVLFTIYQLRMTREEKISSAGVFIL